MLPRHKILPGRPALIPTECFTSDFSFAFPNGARIVKYADPVERIIQRSMRDSRAAQRRDVELAPAAQRSRVAQRKPLEQRGLSNHCSCQKARQRIRFLLSFPGTRQ